MTKLLKLIGVIALAAAALAPAAPARPYLGVYGYAAAFPETSHPVRHVIAAWGQGPVTRILGSLGRVPMLGISPAGYSPQAIASGAGDDWLAEVNQAVHEHGSLVYVRPMGEMNGAWNPYCAFNENGSPRSPAYSTRSFRRAFARIYVILRGGPAAAVNARLRSLGLPPAEEELASNPKSRLRVIWNPHGFSTPDRPGNQPADYYPGDAYVDVVGADVFKTPSNVGHLTGMESIYRAYPNKPFAIPEWGLEGVDDPGFVQRVGDFLRTHLRTEVAVYFNGRGGSVYDLGRKPRSRAAYQRYVLPLGRRS